MDKRARERWLEIDGAFASALDCPEHERDALLARIARDDEDLARSVRALLATEPLAEAALGESASAFAIPLVQAEQQAGRDGDATTVAGTRLGAYRVIAEIGLLLLPAPENILSALAWFDSVDGLLGFVEEARRRSRRARRPGRSWRRRCCSARRGRPSIRAADP